MADDTGSNTGLIAVIILLIVIIVVGFFLWQRDQESQDLKIDIDTGDAGAVVEPGPPVARALPEGIELTVA
jgi:flagellar biosynthesis/type III secretory pathway M-ring protein FliF/YscJ